jgi:L-alanine-DL-glutamate epimerase-like enolase superfamily enzyme
VAQLESFSSVMAALSVELIEQPLPAGRDSELDGVHGPIPLGADESFHGPDLLDHLRGRYQVVNIKLDKAGGLTEALRLKTQAERLGLRIMVGCMGGTSLAMAPALLVASGAMFADLDGPPLLERDRSPGLSFDRGIIAPFDSDVWG